jgi:O-antigen/teichoic acid export membrane protein
MPQNAQQTVARNTIVLLAAQVITRLGGFITAVLLTNYLDVDNFGRYSFLLAYATLFTPLCDLGIDIFIVRELSIVPERRNIVAGTALSIKSALTLISILLITGSFYVMYGSSSLLPFIFIAAAVVSVRNVSGTFSGLFRANQHLTLDSIIQISAKLFELAAVLIAIFLQADLFLLFIILFVSALFQLGYTYYLAHRHSYLSSLSFSYKYILSLLKGGLPFILTSISVIIYFQIDAVMLSTLVGEHETGIYRSATNLVFSLNAFSAAIVIALFPMIAKIFTTHRAEAVNIASNAMFYSLLLAFPIAFGTTVLAQPIIHFLYRNSFAEASSSLRILIWWIPVSFATNIFGHILGAIGLQRKVLLIAAVNAVFNVAANFYFIPKFGAVGASITTVLTEIIGLISLTVVVTKHFGFVYQVGRLFKIVLASLILIPLIELTSSMHLGILIGLGILSYIVALFLLRVLGKKDFEQMKAIVRPRRFHHSDKL